MFVPFSHLCYYLFTMTTAILNKKIDSASKKDLESIVKKARRRLFVLSVLESKKQMDEGKGIRVKTVKELMSALAK
jgi:hypothetical protein